MRPEKEGPGAENPRAQDNHSLTSSISCATDNSTVGRVLEYRRASRQIVRDDERGVGDRYLALIDLVASAQKEDDATICRWARHAIWAEAREFLGYGDGAPSVPTDPYEEAQRKLRARHLVACPTCLAPLSTDEDFERWANLRADHRAELKRFESAVSP
jgi:hypothetical protein